MHYWPLQHTQEGRSTPLLSRPLHEVYSTKQRGQGKNPKNSEADQSGEKETESSATIHILYFFF